ncbi:alpha-tectorin-like [Mercenaria mercenaria]|uniref:alpha-tectorin-like n=1 Tax=Mercenaria mercenaria TaxID=6596 RepID=UPI00234FB3FA|nr:alpha-tectorin-like [Mercenaria mercenaria]
MTLTLYTATFILVSFCGVVALDAVTLFPHDGATSLTVIDDSLEEVSLAQQAFFHGSPRTTIYISENGMVTFEDGFYGGISHPLTKPWIAPSGADVVGNAGELKYETFDTAGSTELTKASDLVNEVYTTDNFQASFVFVVTWYNVKIDNGNRVNTFQLALSSDSSTKRTYAIFLYENEIQWYPEEIGASAGDNTSFYHVCDVGYNGITSLRKKSNSQCGTEGVIVFRLDQSTWTQDGNMCTRVYRVLSCRAKPGIPETNRDLRCNANIS